MVEEIPRDKSAWCVIGKSVRGASHVRTGLPNQDYIKWLPESGASLPIILAISDGHGSDKYFRSANGAQLAVETTLTVINTFLASQLKSPNMSIVRHISEENLPRDIFRSWRNAVADDISNRPLTNAELDRLEIKQGIDTRRQVVLDPVLAYGTTIIAVIVSESFIIYLQLGDGDILTVSEAGEVARPLPKDERLIGNETLSLCSLNSWRDFRVYFQTISGLQSAPSLILLSTDGYSNSFREPNGFLKVGSDILEIIRSDGIYKVKDSLEMWLSEASQTGSGDDITVGIISRISSLVKPNEFQGDKNQIGTGNGVVCGESISSAKKILDVEDKTIVDESKEQNKLRFFLNYLLKIRGKRHSKV
jgi:serine/threonine protein phosphatase PrpC